EGRLICRCHGNDCGNLLSLAHAWLFRAVLPDPLIIEKLKEVARTGKGTAALHFTQPIPNHILRFRETDHPITSISVRVRYIDATAPLDLKRYTMKDSSGQESVVQHGQVSIAGKIFEMLMPFSSQFERGVLKLTDDVAYSRKPDYHKEPGFEGEVW